MKIYRFVTATCMAAALIIIPAGVGAQETAMTRQQIITARCKEVRLLLDELQRRDLVARTNLGREYESIAKLLDAFTQRVRNNNLPAAQFEQLTTQFDDAARQFRSAYVQYDDSLLALQRVDCQNKPADFDTQLAQTRNLRDATEGAHTHAAAIAAQYRNLMAQLQSSLPDQNQEDSR